MSRNTFSLFGCEGQLPTANYDLEQAVQDGFLTPFEVFEHTTQFLREGIRLGRWDTRFTPAGASTTAWRRATTLLDGRIDLGTPVA